MFGKRLSGGAIGVANIESSSVSFSIVKIHSEKSASVATTRYAELPLEERTSGQRLFALKQRLLDIAKQALADYAKASRGNAVKKIYAIVHAPWAQGAVVKTAATFPQETYISAKIISDCAAKALAGSRDKSDYLDVQQLPIMLNGYRTAYPEGKYAHLIEVAALMSSCDGNVRQEITSTLRGIAPAAHITIHSGAGAITEALEIARPHIAEAVCMHVSGEGTEIIVVRDGIAENYFYIAEGLRAMLSRAFPKMRPEDARTAVRMMQRHEGSDTGSAQTQEALLVAEAEMAHAYGDGLAKISAQTRLPNTLLLLAEADIAPWLQKFFERIDFSQFTATAQPFTVDVISASEFGAIDAGGEKNGDLDVAIAVSHIMREQYR